MRRLALAAAVAARRAAVRVRSPEAALAAVEKAAATSGVKLALRKVLR